MAYKWEKVSHRDYRFAVSECKQKNYTTYKNRKNITGKLEKNKYCPVLPQRDSP